MGRLKTCTAPPLQTPHPLLCLGPPALPLQTPYPLQCTGPTSGQHLGPLERVHAASCTTYRVRLLELLAVALALTSRAAATGVEGRGTAQQHVTLLLLLHRIHQQKYHGPLSAGRTGIAGLRAPCLSVQAVPVLRD